MEASAKDTPSITKSKRKRLRKSMKNNACGPVDVLANHATTDLPTQDKEEEFEPDFVIKTKGFLRNEMRDRGLDEQLPQERPRSFFESLFCSSSDDDGDYLYDYFGGSDESTEEDENWFKWYKSNSFRRQNSSRRSGEQYKAEDVDGYVGDQDLDSVLNYIEGTPNKKNHNNKRDSVGDSAKKKNHNGSAEKKDSTEQNGGSSAKKKNSKTKHRDSLEANPKNPNQKSHARRSCGNMA